MRKPLSFPTLAAALALVLSAGLLAACAAAQARSLAAHPNILFLLTDDLDANLGTLDTTPHIKRLAEQGVTFSNFFVNVSLCCPSRTSILRGQYSQNTQIVGNSPPSGGFEKAHELGLENSTVATWLHDAGYRTALMGKYLNGYPNTVAKNYIPPGWDEWDSPNGGNPYSEFDYDLNENGTTVHYGHAPADYMTDVLSRTATSFITRTVATGKPFFLYLATYAPHQPATPAPDQAGKFVGVRAPRLPSFDEADVSDKPEWVRSRPLLTVTETAQIDNLYRDRLRTMQTVDDMLASLIQTLQATGQLDNTYIFFNSDNGFHLGEHRLLPGKWTAYEEDIKVPLIVRGPGVPAGRVVDKLTGNVDLAPTFAEIAGATVPNTVDGRSLVLWLRAIPPPSVVWRQAFLIQHGVQDVTDEPTNSLLEPPDLGDLVKAVEPIPDFHGLRTQDFAFVDYATGERELYDLRADPYELDNQAAHADPALLAMISTWADILNGCAGASCRAIESQAPNLACPRCQSFLPLVKNGVR